MEQKTACLREYLEVVGGVLLKGPLMTRRSFGTLRQLCCYRANFWRD